MTEDITDFSETQEMRQALIKGGHPELVVKSITASIQRLEGRVKWCESEIAKKVDDTGAWRYVHTKIITRRDELIGRLTWAVGIPAAIAILGLLGHYVWKGIKAT